MSEGSTVGRRALISTALVAAGAAAGGAGMRVYDQQALDKAYADGMAAGRKAALNQIKQINGVPVLTAVQVSHNTQQATKYIAQPVGSMLDQIGSNALSALISAISTVQGIPFLFSGVDDLLGHLKSLLTTWQNNLSSLGFSLSHLSEAQVEGCVMFMEGLATALEPYLEDSGEV